MCRPGATLTAKNVPRFSFATTVPSREIGIHERAGVSCCAYTYTCVGPSARAERSGVIVTTAMMPICTIRLINVCVSGGAVSNSPESYPADYPYSPEDPGYFLR